MVIFSHVYNWLICVVNKVWGVQNVSITKSSLILLLIFLNKWSDMVFQTRDLIQWYVFTECVECDVWTVDHLSWGCKCTLLWSWVVYFLLFLLVWGRHDSFFMMLSYCLYGGFKKLIHFISFCKINLVIHNTKISSSHIFDMGKSYFVK